MDQEQRIELLQKLQPILNQIVIEANGDVELYDSVTQEVDKALSRYRIEKKLPIFRRKRWAGLQEALFMIYKSILDF